MLLGVILMFCFEFLRIFGEKSQMSKRENLGKHEPLRRGVTYAVAWDALAAARPGCQNGTPRVRHGIALLCRSIAVLRRGVDTIH